MSRPCEGDHPISPATCRLCWHYLNTPEYRARWDGKPLPQERNAPCIYLGEVVDRAGCNCPGRWKRKCAAGRGAVTVADCQQCPEYETD